VTRALYVDWENIWISLRCRGYSVEPSDVTAALLAAAFGDDVAGVSVYIATNRHFPSHLEIQAIHDAVEGFTGVPAIVDRVLHRGLPKDNVADTSLAFRVGRAVGRGELTDLVIASADSDLANLASLALRESEPPIPVTIVFALRRGYRPPSAESGVKLVSLLPGTHHGLPPIATTGRQATREDRAAWALARACSTVNRSNEAAVLHLDPPNGSGPPSWWGRKADPGELDLLHDIDEVWWHVHQLHRQRLKLTPADAVTTLANKVPERLGQRLTEKVDALLAADLLRLDADGHVRPDPISYEAVLMPLRRLMLEAVLRPGLRMNQLRSRHLNVRHHDEVTATQASAAWKRVTSAVEAWQLARIRGSGKDAHYMVSRTHALVADTESRARLILAAFGPSSGALSTDEVRARAGDWVSGRWMRILWNVGMLLYDRNTRKYRPGPRALPPA
jgi:hypothetical protein